MNPEPKRVIEIALALYQAKGKLQYCRSVKVELGITAEMVESMSLAGGANHEINALRGQLIKAVCKKLREFLNQIALEKGVLEIGKPLPTVGGWNERILKGFGVTGMLIIPGSLGQNPTNRCTQVDQLNNPEFLKMLQ